MAQRYGCAGNPCRCSGTELWEDCIEEDSPKELEFWGEQFD